MGADKKMDFVQDSAAFFAKMSRCSNKRYIYSGTFFGVELMCRQLGVSVGRFHDSLISASSSQSQDNEILLPRVRRSRPYDGRDHFEGAVQRDSPATNWVRDVIVTQHAA